MRTWQVERRQRTRHLIELGGLVVKAGIVELTNDDRATIYGAMLWIAAKLQSHEGEHAHAVGKIVCRAPLGDFHLAPESRRDGTTAYYRITRPEVLTVVEALHSAFCP
ncbi:conjugal transfer protein TraD [Mesorhizobium sp. ORM6]